MAARFTLVIPAFTGFPFMLQLITILNRCHHFPGFVYHQARFSSDHKSIEIAVRPRKGSRAVCSRCHQPEPGYDQLAERRFPVHPLCHRRSLMVTLSWTRLTLRLRLWSGLSGLSG